MFNAVRTDTDTLKDAMSAVKAELQVVRDVRHETDLLKADLRVVQVDIASVWKLAQETAATADTTAMNISRLEANTNKLLDSMLSLHDAHNGIRQTVAMMNPSQMAAPASVPHSLV